MDIMGANAGSHSNIFLRRDVHIINLYDITKGPKRLQKSYSYIRCPWRLTKHCLKGIYHFKIN